MKRAIWQLTALLLGLVLLPIVHAVPARADEQ